MSDAKPWLRPTFFRTAAELRRWLSRHHARERELWVGYYKKSSGRKSITYSESVDEALCYGWIDGVRKSVDADSYANRFTPRRRGSSWSDVNIGRARALIAAQRMRPPGLAAFEARRPGPSDAEEQRRAPVLEPALAARFRSNAAAWHFFEAQPPGYRRLALWWVVSGKRLETRLRRLDTLIADSAAGLRLAPLRRARDE